MIYIDKLKDLQTLIGDDPVALIGFHKKHPKLSPFHKGHLHCIDQVKDLDVKWKIAYCWDSERAAREIWKQKDASDRPMDLEYMKNFLSKTNIDIFWMMDHFDFYDSVFSKIDFEEHKKTINEIVKKEGYSTNFNVMWWFVALEFDKLFYRKYWVGSSKEPVRKELREFCKKYTRGEIYMFPRIHNKEGKVYTSSGGIT